MNRIHEFIIWFLSQLLSIPNVETAAPTVAPDIPQPTLKNLEPDSTEPHQMEEEAPLDPEIARFVKMLQVGVPLKAVEQKMQAEGFDPALLDHNPGHPNQKSASLQPEEFSSSNDDS